MDQNTSESSLTLKLEHQAEAILKDRERRSDYTLTLIESYQKPVFVGKINYPGLCKNTENVNSTYEKMCETFINALGGEYDLVKHWQGADGPALIVVLKKSDLEWKRKCVQIEESHPHGRIWDLDVYSLESIPLSREDLGLGHRSCLVCSDSAKVCTALKKHSIQKIIRRIDSIIET